MNCEDISRIVDSGSFAALTEAERHDGEKHSRSCRRCLPLWFAHAHLAEVPIPDLPIELAMRWQEMKAVNAYVPVRSGSRRRFFVVGGLVAMAAAAAVLIVNVANAPAPVPPAAVAMPKPVEAMLSQESRVPIATKTPELESSTEIAPTGELPLLPAPLELDQSKSEQLQMAFRKAVELYPELTEGPEVGGFFVVSLALRADGTVLNSTKRMTTLQNVNEVSRELGARLPADARTQIYVSANKGRRLPDGRVLRGNLSLVFSWVAHDYDPSRSSDRVREIVRASRPGLAVPSSNGGMNVLSVFLSEDGRIEREIMEFHQFKDLKEAPSPRSEDNESFAKDLADRLGLSVTDIGLIGSVYLQEPVVQTLDESGNLRIDKPRSLLIHYAWPRRAAETAPRFGQGIPSSFVSAGVDTDKASAIVKRVMPAAFSETGRTNVRHVLILTEEGRVIRTASVNREGNWISQVQELMPGLVVVSVSSANVTNSAGKKAEIQLVWEASDASKERMEKQREGDAKLARP